MEPLQPTDSTMTTSASSPMLHTIDDPSMLRALPREQLTPLAAELRQFLIETVAASGGHLASGLGTVELSIALHYCFDTPRDTIVWDVGHQCYPHKVLTGRRDQMRTIRKRPGLSGFLRRDESHHDLFGAGHSSTSISAALGMASAAALQKKSIRSVAVIGDGALTAGLAFEALHHAGGLNANLLVVLNDNGMSISENVGALSQHLTTQGREPAEDAEAFFRTLGFTYHGPIDGHDVDQLVETLNSLRDVPGPRLLHVITRKGKGYAAAEADPIKYHGVTPFDPTRGIVSGSPASTTYTQIFGDSLCELANADPRIVAVTPAMREGSGLVAFAKQFPERYHDVGIAEQHAVTFAAGLATQGLRPVVAIYSTFLQRAYDQLVHDVCLQRLPVTLAIDRAGLVGPDGATHHGGLDHSFLRCVPNLTVMAPSNAAELRAMLRTAVELGEPCAVRYPRTAATGVLAAGEPLPRPLPIGRGEWVRRGSGIAILAFGTLLDNAHDVADIIDASVANMRFVKPLDESLILELAAQHDILVTIEESAITGGAGSAVAEFLGSQGLETAVLRLGLPDRPIEHGTRDQCLQEAGLDVPGIFDAIARHCAVIETQRHRSRKPLRMRDNAMFNGFLRLLTRSQID